MNVILGKTEVSMIDPPTGGTVLDRSGKSWRIARTGSGNIILRGYFAPLNPSEPHREFLPDGMDLQTFCWWINNHL